MPRILIALVGLLLASHVQAEWYDGEKAIMGTAVTVQLWHEDGEQARDAISAVMAEMHRIDGLMSTWRDDTEMARVNAEAAQHPVDVSEELFGLIRQALAFAPITDGAFDISYASVGFLFDYRQRVRPAKKALNHALEAVDYRLVELDDASRTVHFRRDGVRIDLGGIAKGYAAERGISILRDLGIRHAIVSAGGDTRVLGDRRGRPWAVGIRDPRGDRNDVIATLPLVDEAISTSGDYERFFEEDGKRYHHILNPGTGESPSDVRSVSIIGPDGVWTDALSTGVFVLGVEKGLALIETLKGYEAVIVDAGLGLHVSSGFEDH